MVNSPVLISFFIWNSIYQPLRSVMCIYHAYGISPTAIVLRFSSKLHGMKAFFDELCQRNALEIPSGTGLLPDEELQRHALPLHQREFHRWNPDAIWFRWKKQNHHKRTERCCESTRRVSSKIFRKRMISMKFLFISQSALAEDALMAQTVCLTQSR